MKKGFLISLLLLHFTSCKTSSNFSIPNYVAKIESTSILEYRNYYIGPLGRGSRTRILGYPERCNILFAHRNGKIRHGIMNNRIENCENNSYYLRDSVPLTLKKLIEIFSYNNLISFNASQESHAYIRTLIADSSYAELKANNPDYFDLSYRSKSERFDRKYYYYNFIYIYIRKILRISWIIRFVEELFIKLMNIGIITEKFQLSFIKDFSIFSFKD